MAQGDPQCENGFTKLANEILEALARFKLCGYEFRILLILFRYTYGWKGRKEASLSASFLAKATGIDRRHVQRTLKNLNKKQIISAKNGAGKSLWYRFNKHYNEWKPAPKMAPKATSAKNGADLAPKMAPVPAPKMAHNKEKINIYKESGQAAGLRKDPAPALNNDNSDNTKDDLTAKTLKAIREQERWKKTGIFQ